MQIGNIGIPRGGLTRMQNGGGLIRRILKGIESRNIILGRPSKLVEIGIHGLANEVGRYTISRGMLLERIIQIINGKES